MDVETRDALKQVREDLRTLSAKVDVLCNTISNYHVESVERWTRVEGSTKAAHKRMDEITDKAKERRASGVALWVGVALAVVSAALSLVIGLFTGRKSA